MNVTPAGHAPTSAFMSASDPLGTGRPLCRLVRHEGSVRAHIAARADEIGRIMAEHEATPTHNYKNVEGGIPIRAAL